MSGNECDRPADTDAGERHRHNVRQVALFDRVAPLFTGPIPSDVQRRTYRIVAAAGLPANAAVLDVGTGTGVLIPLLRAAGATRIVACDLSDAMLALARDRHDGPDVTWARCDIVDLPLSIGPFDTVFFNAMFGNVYDPHATLVAAARLLRPGGHVVISHPMGRTWLQRFATAQPEYEVRDLPDAAAAPSMLCAAGLRLIALTDEPNCYILVAGRRSAAERMHEPAASRTEYGGHSPPEGVTNGASGGDTASG